MSMKRRKFIKYFTGSLASVGMSTAIIANQSDAKDIPKHPKPYNYDWRLQPTDKKEHKNVLFILCDDLRFDTFSFLGSPAKTPNIDALMKDSVYFSHACTTTGLCSPSRAALFTGRLGHRTGLDDNCHVWQSRLMGLNLDQTTILEWAREKDYFVGYFGKWHLGADGPIKRGAHRFTKNGFERAQSLPDKPNFDAVKRYYDKSKSYSEKPEYYMTLKGGYEDTATKQKTNDTIEFLNETQNVDLPFFITASFNDPHPPYKVPKPFNTMYDYQKIVVPKSLNEPVKRKPKYQREQLWYWHDVGHMTDDDWRKSTAFYFGAVSMIDKAVGEIIDTLKKNDLWDNTLIVFLGDQGSMIGEHTLYDKGPYSYDELMRVPLLVRVPGMKPRTISRHVSSIDVNQTLVEWMGLESTAQNMDSRSLFPLMEKGNEGWDSPDQAFYRYEWYNGKWYGVRAVRTPDFKYCFNPNSIDELYDLKNDPEEIKNLIDLPEYKNVQSDLEKRLLTHLKSVDDPIYRKMFNTKS